MESSDVHVKYTKLATEYSKLRAQNQVLRKAVVDEKDKTTQLTDLVKSKDQAARKFEQEIDSLTFRNQQLSKRLTVLQEDLDQLENKGNKKGRTRQEGIEVDTNVFSEELQAKIVENERLHARIAEEESSHNAHTVDLENVIRQLKLEFEKYKQQQEQLISSTKEEIEQKRKDLTQQELLTKEKDNQILNLQEQLKNLQFSNIDHSPINRSVDNLSKRGSVQSPSIPRLDREKIPLSTLIEDFQNPIRKLCDGMTLFLTSYSHSLISDNQEDSLHKKLTENVNSNVDCWRNLSECYLIFSKSIEDYADVNIRLDGNCNLEEIHSAVKHCSSSLRKLVTVILQNDHMSDDGWKFSLNRMVSSWESFLPYLNALASQNNPSKLLHESVQSRILVLFSERLDKFHGALADLGAAHAKSICQDGAVSDSSITRALASLTDAAHLICTKFHEDVLFSLSTRLNSAQSTPSSSSHIRIGSRVTSPIDEDSRPLGAEGDAEELNKRLSIVATQLSQLEAEKEHWKLEFQLMQHKQQKENQKLKEVTEELRKLRKQNGTDVTSDDGSMSSGNSTTDVLDGDPTTTSSMIGELTGWNSKSVDREDEIRQHMTARCSKLYLQLTSTSSQTALFQNECEALMRRLVTSEERGTIAEQELEDHRSTIGQIRETLQITSKNYEEQISTMSVHLADLNEKFMSQTEEIEHLRYELKNKKGKK